MPPANDNGQIISAMHSPIVYEMACVLDAEEAAVPGGSAMELKNGKAIDGPFTLARRSQVCNLTIQFRQRSKTSGPEPPWGCFQPIVENLIKPGPQQLPLFRWDHSVTESEANCLLLVLSLHQGPG